RTVERDEHPHEHQEADPSEIEVDLQIAVVGLVRPEHRKRCPHLLQPITEPEALEAGADQRVLSQLEYGRPDFGATGQRRVATRALEDKGPDIECKLQGEKD